MERPIKFINNKKESLFGMFYIPDQQTASAKTGILISVDSIKPRIGTCRLHTIIARYLMDIGYYVMCFDPSGIGDSEGTFEQKQIYEHYCDIQQGKYLNDSKDALDFFKAEFNLSQILLFGICGGAISMLSLAAQESGISGLILLAIPVLFDGPENNTNQDEQVSKISSEVQSKMIISDYVQKLFGLETWKKILSFKINWILELKTVMKAVKIFIIKSTQKLFRPLISKKKLNLEKVPVSVNPKYNMGFQSAFIRSIKQKNQMLFIFAEFDHYTWNFKSEFQDLVLVPGNPFEPFYEITILKKANHIFSSTETQTTLKETLSSWLSRKFPLET